MDLRSVHLISLAVQLIAAGGVYRGETVGDVVSELIDEIDITTRILDHPAECTGCETCAPAPQTAGETGAGIH